MVDQITKRLEFTQYSAALAVTGAWRGTNTDRLYMMSSVGKSFTTEGGIDACVTFTNCGMIRDPITYTLKYHKNVNITTTCVDPMYMNQML